jgi:tRNA A-37 threonylcarbamoyl transferase component Bud32
MEISFEELVEKRGETLASKRNRVELILGDDGTKYIKKVYSCRDSFENESAALSSLREMGVTVPKILYGAPGVLILEYIDGTSYEELLAQLESKRISPCEGALAALEICRWLGAYYDATACSRGDVNLRNFIFTGEKCCGIDFEDTQRAAPPETDMGRIIAFAMSYDPDCTESKAEFINMLLGHFTKRGASCDLIMRECIAELDFMLSRRPNFRKVHERCMIFADNLFKK